MNVKTPKSEQQETQEKPAQQGQESRAPAQQAARPPVRARKQAESVKQITQPAVARNLAYAARQINEELTRHADRRMSLSEAARAKLEDAYADYLAEVGTEAVRIARRANLTTVDGVHVEEAGQRLSPRTGRNTATATAANTIGGLLGGAGITLAYPLLATPGPHGTTHAAVAAVLSLLGFFLLTIGLTLTVARRGG
jgi:hypothetical protein